MNQNDVAYGVIEGHTLFVGIEAFFRRHGLTQGIVDFLVPRLCVAYPKTFWYKLLLPQESEDVRMRQAVTDSETGVILRKWIEAKSVFQRIVFDLRGITILDFGELLPFFEEVRGPLHVSYLCDPPLEAMLLHYRIPDELIATREAALLHHIRNDASKACIIRLPAELTVESLSNALARGASPSVLKRSELVVVDMHQVARMEFSGMSLLAPLIQSFANAYAALTIIADARRSIEKELNRFGFWRVMSAYLIGSYPGGSEPASPYIFPLHVFHGRGAQCNT